MTDDDVIIDITKLPLEVLLDSDNSQLSAIMNRVIDDLDSGIEVLSAFDNCASAG